MDRESYYPGGENSFQGKKISKQGEKISQIEKSGSLLEEENFGVSLSQGGHKGLVASQSTTPKGTKEITAGTKVMVGCGCHSGIGSCLRNFGKGI